MALTGLAVRLIGRGAAIIVIVTAGMSALVVQQYRGLAGAFDLASMQALAENPAIRVLFGRPVALDDPGGFTVWRTGTPLAVLLAVWAMVAAVRITRGEEEAGRWNLLLAGRSRLTWLVGLHLTVILAATVITGVSATAAMIMAGARPGGSALYGAALTLVGTAAALFGGLAGQLVADRRRAVVLAAAGLGAGLLARMVGDAADSLHGLHWISPFGLLGLTEPFGAARLPPLAVLLLANIALAIGVGMVSARRDVGAGLLPTRDRPASRLGWLRSLPRFAVRRSAGALLVWGAGVWLYFLLIGLLASSLTTFLSDNPLFADLAARAGFGSLTTVTGYLASLFALLAIPLGLYAASRIAADSADEQDRHLTLVFAGPVSRRRWFALQVATGVAGVVVLAAGAGVFSWAGATAVGAEVPLGAALAGAFNVVPIAWLSLGAALLAFGWWPPLTFAVGALPAVGGFLLQVLAETLRWPSWALALSPYEHVQAVPYDTVDWAGTMAMTAIAAALAVVGLLGFTRRDLHG
jgi:ABC-2 type transport system permease protein